MDENKKKQISSDKLVNMIGYKIYKETEDGDLIVYRIKKYSATRRNLIVTDSENQIHSIPINDLKEFHILKADGMFMSSIVSVKDESGRSFKDVIISASKVLEIENGIIKPYAICRQSVTDIFYNLLCNDESQQIAGLSVNRDTCPANFDMGIMMLCDKVVKSEMVFFYREDTLEDILDMINIRDYDLVLSTLYQGHAKASKNPAISLKKEDKGWCKNLKTLLHENNFQSDINQMLGITDIMFNFSDYIIEKPLPDEKKGNYYTVDDDLKLWLSGLFSIAINDLTVLEYEHDINLADLNNTLYFFLRDSQKKLYICVYTTKGKFLESDLEDQYNKKSFVDEWRVDFYNKYKEAHKNDNI